MKVTKLKPCPFCGKKIASLQEFGGTGYYQVICVITDGGCGSSSGAYEDLEEPIEEWNRRVKG
jgi:Lar family restriction alleviation protein